MSCSMILPFVRLRQSLPEAGASLSAPRSFPTVLELMGAQGTLSGFLSGFLGIGARLLAFKASALAHRVISAQA